MSWKTAETRLINVGGTFFVYRETGPEGGIPLVFLHHLTAVLDDWDPRVMDGIAQHRKVIAFDNRGVGASEGQVPDSIEEMAEDAIAFIRALGHEKVDLLGFSLGGGVAQMVVLQCPSLIRRLVLTGTGPRGGGGIEQIKRVVLKAYLKAAVTLGSPRAHLFFPRTPMGKRAAKEYLARLKERTENRDKPISLQARRAQLKAIRAAGLHESDDLSKITQPVFIANGDNDVMVSSELSSELAERIPNSRLVIYPESGHGGIFQHHESFVSDVTEFLS